ncbi:MAG: transporter [Candidatus Eisenbacteria bacterium]|uniref:Transporter n=1 Tax=Eiseniibacteriota bacterium TaxID=2212470 RepID=A0A948RWY4_UNCEI|nr:transporter [Candidatus Eisenbacteria bacterium]MBU1948543.1 transporter [Candidatus Eisenbacteria bacterium]MBU2691067.1 transporter [Candidatus Eisenbacteria bacterium]
MSLCHLQRLHCIISLGIMLGLVLIPQTAAAQIGAIGGSFGGGAGDDMYHRGPVLTESGYVLDKGQLTLGTYFIYGELKDTSVDYIPIFDDYGFPYAYIRGDDEVTLTSTQMTVSAFYGLTEKLTVGGYLYPMLNYDIDHDITFSYQGASIDTSTSESISGFGDLKLYSKYQLWKQELGRTRVALFGLITLPTGDDEVGIEGTIWTAGIAGSHRRGRWNLHGDASVSIPSDENYDTSLSFDASAVYAVGAKVGLSGEVLASVSDGETYLDISPGLRFKAAPNIFVSGALVVNLQSPELSAFDYQAFLGLDLLF